MGYKGTRGNSEGCLLCDLDYMGYKGTRGNPEGCLLCALDCKGQPQGDPISYPTSRGALSKFPTRPQIYTFLGHMHMIHVPPWPPDGIRSAARCHEPPVITTCMQGNDCAPVLTPSPLQLRLEGVLDISHVNRKNPDASFVSPPEMRYLRVDNGHHAQPTNTLYYWFSGLPMREKVDQLPIPKCGIAIIPLTREECSKLPCPTIYDTLSHVALAVLMPRNTADHATAPTHVLFCTTYDVGSSGLPGIPSPPGGSNIQPQGSHGALFYQKCMDFGSPTHIRSNVNNQHKTGAGTLQGNTRDNVHRCTGIGCDSDGPLRSKVNEDFSYQYFMETAIANPGLYPSWDALSPILKFVLSNGDIFTTVGACYSYGLDPPQHVRPSHVWPLGHFTALGFAASVSTYLKQYPPGPHDARISLWPPSKGKPASGPHAKGAPYLSTFLLNSSPADKLICSFSDLHKRRPHLNRLSDYHWLYAICKKLLLTFAGDFHKSCNASDHPSYPPNPHGTLLSQLEELQFKPMCRNCRL